MIKQFASFGWNLSKIIEILWVYKYHFINKLLISCRNHGNKWSRRTGCNDINLLMHNIFDKV